MDFAANNLFLCLCLPYHIYLLINYNTYGEQFYQMPSVSHVLLVPVSFLPLGHKGSPEIFLLCPCYGYISCTYYFLHHAPAPILFINRLSGSCWAEWSFLWRGNADQAVAVSWVNNSNAKIIRSDVNWASLEPTKGNKEGNSIFYHYKAIVNHHLNHN